MKLRLVYTRENVDKPILAEIVLKTGIPINILEARVLPTEGELVVDVPATGDSLRRVVALFQEAGVSVTEITATIEIDHDRCTSCGACISPCPVQAIRFGPDWRIEFDEEKCIRCRICVDACPVRAITPL